MDFGVIFRRKALKNSKFGRFCKSRQKTGRKRSQIVSVAPILVEKMGFLG
jgi:hypothetical protein